MKCPVDNKILFSRIKRLKDDIRATEAEILLNNGWQRFRVVSPSHALWFMDLDGVRLVMDKAAAMKAVKEMNIDEN